MGTCRYCGATIALHGTPAAASPPFAHVHVADPGAAVFLEHPGDNKIEIIKVIRQFTGLGLREAKELCERAPCVVADWPGDRLKQGDFRNALARAGARVR